MLHISSLIFKPFLKFSLCLRSESHMPLTWDLQLPANTIAESEAAVDRIASDIEEEEGSVSSNESSSESLSSEDSKGGKGGTERKERSSSSPPKVNMGVWVCQRRK